MINDLLSDENKLCLFNLGRLKEEVSLFEQVDSTFGKFFESWKNKFRNDYTIILGNLFAQTQRYFCNSFLLILRGQSPLHFALLRGAIECTGQAYLIHKDNKLANIWLKDWGKERFRNTFKSSAMFPKNSSIMAKLGKDYKITCGYGAHASLPSGAQTMKKIKGGFKFYHFHNDYLETKRHILHCLSVAARFLKAYLEFLGSFIDTSEIEKMVDDYCAKLTLTCDSFRTK